MAIEIPRELIPRVFQNFSSEIRDNLRAGALRFGSFIYDNISGIVPDILLERNG